MRITALFAALFLVACSNDEGSVKVEAVDLDHVLDAFEAALKTPDPQAAAPTSEAAPASEGGEAAIAGGQAPTAAAPAEDPARTQKFVARFGEELNSRKLDGSHQVGVFVRPDGAIEGFRDLNKNETKDSGESQLFWVEVDAERNRVVASQIIEGQAYHRPYSTGGLATGLIGGYILGRMLGRQNGFFAGGGRPGFGSMNMSPRGYHGAAMNQARSNASARARSAGGSRGFRGGK